MSIKPPVKKSMKIGNDDFQVINTSQLENLPNEILLKIFDYIEIEDLIICCQVSRRIRTIVRDDSLWQKVNQQTKINLPKGLLELIPAALCIVLVTGWIVAGLVMWNLLDLCFLFLDEVIAGLIVYLRNNQSPST